MNVTGTGNVNVRSHVQFVFSAFNMRFNLKVRRTLRKVRRTNKQAELGLVHYVEQAYSEQIMNGARV